MSNLSQILSETQNKTGDQQVMEVPMFILDIISNADRRSRSGRYDDATVRIYSAIEKMAQFQLLYHHDIDNSKVDLSNMPDAIVQKLCLSADDQDKPVVELGLLKSYEMLEAFGNPIGIRFREEIKEFKKLMNIRNMSILAHGSYPISKSSYDSLRTLALRFLSFDEHLMPVFPKMDFEDVFFS